MKKDIFEEKFMPAQMSIMIFWSLSSQYKFPVDQHIMLLKHDWIFHRQLVIIYPKTYL